MKYLVELKFTNPSHEHVSLRRRVESVTRLVEATNEDQAVLRASQQQRALGFFIKEAKVVKEKSHDKVADETMVAKGKEVMKKAENKDEKEEEKAEDIEENKGTESYPLLKKREKLKSVKLKMKEGFDPDPSDIAAHLVKKHGKGKVTKDHVDAYERDRDSNKAIDKKAVMKHVEKMSEEVELDEASKEGKDVMRNMRASMKAMDLRHGIDSDKRDAGYKMSPAVRAAQKKSDALSKVVKRPQAGTLAAAKLKEEFEYIEEKLTAADPASKWISDFVKSDNPKFAGKSKKERIQQALGAYYAAKRGE